MKKTFSHNMGAFAIVSAGLLSFIAPISVFAQTSGSSLSYNCNGTATTTDAKGTPPCDFNALINTGTHLVEWMFFIAVPVMVALLAYAGILYMTGIEKNISHAKGMFMKVALGFTIMLIAYVVITTLVGWIGNSAFTTSSNGTASNPAVLLNNH